MKAQQDSIELPEQGTRDDFARVTAYWRERAQRAEATTATLRAALVTLVGADGREELEAMEAAIRASVAPAVDKAAGIDAIQALLTTLPEEATDAR